MSQACRNDGRRQQPRSIHRARPNVGLAEEAEARQTSFHKVQDAFHEARIVQQQEQSQPEKTKKDKS